MRPIFRRATPADIPFILDLLREFYDKAGDIYQIEFDAPSTIQTIGNVLARGICLVGPSSCAGAIIGRFPYNHAALIAHVPFWYFTKPSGIHIFDALMVECKAAGATHINPSSLYPDNRIARFYSKKGFRSCEIQSISHL